MNDKFQRIQVTVQQMKRVLSALESLSQELPTNPHTYAVFAAAPMDDLSRMLNELEQYFAELREVPTPTAASY
jgi:hypothetical protein